MSELPNLVARERFVWADGSVKAAFVQFIYRTLAKPGHRSVAILSGALYLIEVNLDNANYAYTSLRRERAPMYFTYLQPLGGGLD